MGRNRLSGRVLFLLLMGMGAPQLWGQNTVGPDTLQEVVVRGEHLVRTADRFIMQVLAETHQDGVQLLQDAPGVSVTEEGISINGMAGTKVYVNNRLVRLDAGELSRYLRTLRSEDIRQIEVVPLSGADKDADEKGGAIYIRLRKKKEHGWGELLTLTADVARSFRQYQLHTGWTLHRRKWDGYLTVTGTTVPKDRCVYEDYRTYALPGAAFTSHNDERLRTNTLTLDAGLTLSPDSMNLLEADIHFMQPFRKSTARMQSDFTTEEQRVMARNTYQRRMSSGTGGFHLTYRLKWRGFELEWQGAYDAKRTADRTLYDCRQYVDHTLADTLYRFQSTARYGILATGLSLKWLIDKKQTFSAGLKYTYTSLRDDAFYAGDDAHQRKRTDVYALDYAEHIGAAWATWAFRTGHWTVSAGMRGEWARNVNRTERLQTVYANLFPNLNVSYAFDWMNHWMLIGQAGRYIERPPFAMLNPNRHQLSDYLYREGNPRLRPMYIRRFSLTLVAFYHYTLTIGGNLHQDLFRALTKQDGTNPAVSYVTYENHYREDHWFLAISVPVRLGKRTAIQVNLVPVWQRIRLFAGGSWQTHALCFGHVSAQVKLPWENRLEVQYDGTSRLFSGNSEVNPLHVFNLRLTKALWNGKGSLTIGVDNLFDKGRGNVCRLGDYTIFSHTRTASLGRTWKIGLSCTLSKGAKPRRKNGQKPAADTETLRFNEK